MSYEEEYLDDYNIADYESDPIDLNSKLANITKCNFIMKDDIEKERQKKIEEFIQFSSLSKEEA